jgi:hypothetical protein
MWKVTNCYLDPSKRMLQRVAARLDSEPLVGGRRLRPRDSVEVTQEYVERNHTELERHVKAGVLEMTAPDGQVIDKSAIEAHPDVVDDLAPQAPVEPVVSAPEVVAVVESAPAVVEQVAETTPETPKKKWGKKGA